MTGKKKSPLAQLLANLPPYSGLRNDKALPAFLQPGNSLPPFAQYMARQPPQAPPQAPPMPPPQAVAAPPAPPPQTGGQGYAGPDPVAMGIPPQGVDPMQDPRYLPEQWRGAFNMPWAK